MTEIETIDRLTELVKMQADIIREQAGLLAQFGAIAELEEKIKAVADTRDQLTDT